MIDTNYIKELLSNIHFKAAITNVCRNIGVCFSWNILTKLSFLKES